MNEYLEDKLEKFGDAVVLFHGVLLGENELMVKDLINLLDFNNDRKTEIVADWKRESVVSEKQQIETLNLVCRAINSLKSSMTLRCKILELREKAIRQNELYPKLMMEIEELMKKKEQ
jgi:hypothetical protein